MRKNADIVKFDNAFWISVGNTVADGIRAMAKSGKRPDGKSFPPYTPEYALRKSQGKYKRQTSTSTKPDLTLTGDMLRNTQVIGTTKNSVTIGWADPADIDKVLGNAKRGRPVTLKRHPVDKKTEKAVLVKFNKKISDNSRKINNRIVITV